MEYGNWTYKAGAAEGSQKEVSFLTFVDISYAEHKCPLAYKNTQVYWTVFCWMKNLTFSNSIHLFLSFFFSFFFPKMSQSLSLGWACHVFLCLKFWFPWSEVNIIKWQKIVTFLPKFFKFIFNLNLILCFCYHKTKSEVESWDSWRPFRLSQTRFSYIYLPWTL